MVNKINAVQICQGQEISDHNPKYSWNSKIQRQIIAKFLDIPQFKRDLRKRHQRNKSLATIKWYSTGELNMFKKNFHDK